MTIKDKTAIPVPTADDSGREPRTSSVTAPVAT
jgi:hypothetical protein